MTKPLPLTSILPAPRASARVPLMKLPLDIAALAKRRGARTWGDVHALIATGLRTPRCKIRMGDADREALRVAVQQFTDAVTVRLNATPGAIEFEPPTVKPIFAILPKQRADVGVMQLREERRNRRRERAEVYSTEDTTAPPTRKVLRTTTDAALDRMLGPFLFSALGQIRAAYLAAFGSGGVASCASLETRVDISARGSGGSVDRSGAWTDFARRLTADQAGAIVAVAVRGETLRECERGLRKRNGWAAEHVKAACEVWFGNGAVLKRKRLRLRAWRG